MHKRRFAVNLMIFFLLLVFTIPCFAVPDGNWELIPGLRFWGIDLEADYYGLQLVPSLTTALVVMGGFGYETFGYYRNPDTTLYYPQAENNLALYPKFNLDWVLGIRQGIVKHPAKNVNLLEVYLYYRGLYDDNEETTAPNALIFASALPDQDKILQNSIVTGLFFNDLNIDDVHKNRDGLTADFTFEYVPAFFYNELGGADYYRFNTDIRGYLTLIKPDQQADKNIFNLYICDRIIFDTLWGAFIPVNARQTVLNRDPLPKMALGNAVRGIEAGRFDGYIKLINNFDIRMNLWSIQASTLIPGIKLPIEDFVPGILLCFDSAFFNNLEQSLALIPENFFYTAGAGIYLTALGIDFMIMENFFFNESSFSTTFDFALHF